MSEPDTLKDILLGLKKEEGLFSSERTIVMDAGIATEDNIALIKKNGYKYDKIIERIGRLKERYKVGNLYTIKVKHTDGKAVDIQFDKNDQAQAKEDAVGTYVLRTNRLDLGGEEISKLHRSLTTVEEIYEIIY